MLADRDQPLALLRDVLGGVPHVRAEAETAYRALFGVAGDPDLDLPERIAIAAHVAEIEHCRLLAQAFRALTVAPLPAPEPRLLAHLEGVVRQPGRAQPRDAAALAEAGLSPRRIVIATQVAGFVTFVVRVLAGRTLLKAAA